MDVDPSFGDGQLTLAVFIQGKPVQGAEILLEDVESPPVVQTTNEAGQVVLQPSSRYVIRAKHLVAEAGEFESNQFSERRYYCTLVLDVEREKATQTGELSDSNQRSKPVGVTLQKVDSEFAELPRGMTSFGATVLNDRIYIIGGKSGKTDSYAKSYQNRNVYCLNLDGTNNQWQVAGENLGLQGPAIVAAKKKKNLWR